MGAGASPGSVLDRLAHGHVERGLHLRAEPLVGQVGVLVLSQDVEPSYAMRLLEEHPERVGYLLKERVYAVAILVDALPRIAEGETVVDPTIVSRLVGRRRRVDPLAELTEREREVLGLIAEGSPARLFVTERTVEAHVKQIFLELQLGVNPDSHRRVLAVLAYLARGHRPRVSGPFGCVAMPAWLGSDHLIASRRGKGEAMTFQEIVALHPVPPSPAREALVRCAAECLDCTASCTACADANLGEADSQHMTRSIRLCLDCADVCVATSRIAIRQTESDAGLIRAVVEGCAAACVACAEECERHAHHHEHCRICAETCRRCKDACDAVLAVL